MTKSLIYSYSWPSLSAASACCSSSTAFFQHIIAYRHTHTRDHIITIISYRRNVCFANDTAANLLARDSFHSQSLSIMNEMNDGHLCAHHQASNVTSSEIGAHEIDRVRVVSIRS